MENPYAVLGLEPGTDETQIRNRYLELVKQFPPEKFPREAAEVRAAYDILRDPITRLNSQLFDTASNQTFDSLLNELTPSLTGQRFPTELLLKLGRK